MKQIPKAIFQDKLKDIKWKKIYAREYGVQYSEMALLCLSQKANYHIPKPSVNQVIIPDGNNTVFYIDEISWEELVNSLNLKYTSHINKLKEYEKQFENDGKKYISIAEEISNLNFQTLSNNQLKDYYLRYQNSLFAYSVFAWTSFILNIYVSDRATEIIDFYIKKNNLQGRRQEIIDSLFQPFKRAAILELQNQIEKYNGNLTKQQFTILFENYKWLSCLDLHNIPWSKEQFKQTIASFKSNQHKRITSFNEIIKELKITREDLNYLNIAKRFVYIKDARDDFRRKGVYLVLSFFAEIAKRMKINPQAITYVLSSEIIEFLDGKTKISPKIIEKRKNGFVMYLDIHLKTVCLQSESSIRKILDKFHLQSTTSRSDFIKGRTACAGIAKGSVVIVHGIKDLKKVKEGCVLVAVTTHPDYTAAMRKAVAVVTDEGGITSHAAIVAREYNIPCIVGTHNATKILKDGDEVEVDANEGLVKK